MASFTRKQRFYRFVSTLVVAISGGACVELVSDKVLQDCLVRETNANDPSIRFCIKASDYTTDSTCVPASAFDDKHDCLVLDADATLCEEEAQFDMEVFLAESNVSLDCNEQVIAHAEGGRARSGIRTPYQYSVSDISISSCFINQVARYGIDLKRFFRGDELEGDMQGHQRISITDVSISDSARVGIYVGQNSKDTTISYVVIQRAFSGIYLEAGSNGTLVNNATIVGCYERAGIHVDSSANNTIEYSVFRGNRGGAILLYKNCGEVYGQVCPIRRRLGASNNTIRYNEFYGNNVSVADRQFKTYAINWCSGIDVLGNWRDRANGNDIHDNEFHDGSLLQIKDSPNRVSSNHFNNSVLEVGAASPIGDSGFHIKGSVVKNIFDGDSWISANGSERLAFDELEVAYNIREDGSCYNEYREKLDCTPGKARLVERQLANSCYGGSIAIEGALCNGD